MSHSVRQTFPCARGTEAEKAKQRVQMYALLASPTTMNTAMQVRSTMNRILLGCQVLMSRMLACGASQGGSRVQLDGGDDIRHEFEEDQQVYREPEWKGSASDPSL